MRFFFDTEFVEDGRTIELISIAVVSEDGREYHAVNSDFDRAKAENHPFVKANVLPHVMATPHCFWKSKSLIGGEIVTFVGDEPEFWADFAAYDWVALCQIYGRMVDLPKTWPFFCRDVQQLRKLLNVPRFTVLSHGEHDALADARECKARYDVLTQAYRMTHPFALTQPFG